MLHSMALCMINASALLNPGHVFDQFFVDNLPSFISARKYPSQDRSSTMPEKLQCDHEDKTETARQYWVY